MRSGARRGTAVEPEHVPSGVAPATVLVTGAGGMIGRAVLDQLDALGVAAVALVPEDPGDLRASRVVVGDAGDPPAVREAVRGVDAVVHLAALASPHHDTADQVFTRNTRATFVVLEEAGTAGVRRAVIAGSYGITGLPWAAGYLAPSYLPVDESLPLQIEDAYGLSKQVDEATAAMMHRRHAMTVLSLRFPFVGHGERLDARVEQGVRDPGSLAADVWAYLHTTDAARACWLGLTAATSGFHAVFLAAPDTSVPYPTADLVAAFHPGVELRAPFPGRTCPIDVSAATALLGFRAEHELGLAERPLVEAEAARQGS